MINVTRTYLPPLEEYIKHVERIWENEWLTNRGELVLELEELLKVYLGIRNILCVNNGTIALQIAIRALGLTGEIITTPFSYVATTSSIVWENCVPVFVDIDPEHFTIDETKIEEAITPSTSAILATHVYGNPCNVEAIESISRKYDLKVIYDAAHCFGVEYKGSSIFEYGDISTCSFHATKLFHTGEGGGIFWNDEALSNKIFYSHNFGHKGQDDFYGVGVNGKLSELQAAMGLTVLPHIKSIMDDRKRVCHQYDQGIDSSVVQTISVRSGTLWNYSYYPVLFNSEERLNRVMRRLNEKNIFPKRYFHPSLNTLGYVASSKMGVAESTSKRVLCLPLFYGLNSGELNLICRIINETI